MGFYYSSGQPPDDDGEHGDFREVIAITVAVFQVLALPVGILLGSLSYLVFIFWMFSINPLFGLGAILPIVAALVARAVWEARHPPHLG